MDAGFESFARDVLVSAPQLKKAVQMSGCVHAAGTNCKLYLMSGYAVQLSQLVQHRKLGR